MSADRGELAIVLHTHMPYVEGFGTWPFGEEWLWEAMSTSYLPLLDVLQAGTPLTLSLTPVLCDQLEAPGIAERFLTFLRDVRGATHEIDIKGCRDTGEPTLADELERSREDYQRAEARFASVGGDLLGALAPYASWTSSATHAVLPLLATDTGVRAQVASGIASHRRRFGDWRGGFWLPECAHESRLDALLGEEGVQATCVDLTDVFGSGDARHLRPLRSEHGPLLVPLDRETIELVWCENSGYPASGGYRDYHHHTVHHHRPWSVDGATYDRDRAAALAREHARDFVARTQGRLDAAAPELDEPGLIVCALDTELLGHWWFEGVTWLAAVVEEAEAAGLALSRLDDALDGREGVPAPDVLPVTTWGTPRDLSTWDGPAVADIAFAARAAELRAVRRAGRGQLSSRAVRELFALQSSDWAFLVARDLAAPYGRDRAESHARDLDAALEDLDSRNGSLRNLAPDLAHFG